MLDSYTNTDAKYEWKQGPVKSVERSPEISLPQMDIVDIQASESVEIHSIGMALNLTNKVLLPYWNVFIAHLADEQLFLVGRVMLNRNFVGGVHL